MVADLRIVARVLGALGVHAFRLQKQGLCQRTEKFESVSRFLHLAGKCHKLEHLCVSPAEVRVIRRCVYNYSGSEFNVWVLLLIQVDKRRSFAVWLRSSFH